MGGRGDAPGRTEDAKGKTMPPHCEKRVPDGRPRSNSACVCVVRKREGNLRFFRPKFTNFFFC